MKIERKVRCPCCDSEDYDYVYISEVDDSVLGCTSCVRTESAWIYMEEVEEQSIESHINACIDAALGK